jgi:F0F1-type ATP synthase assembly protein I
MIGIWLGERTGISWMMIPFFVVGALAGFTNIYKMVKKRLK